MSCLGCSRLERDDCVTVALSGGEVVCNYCPEWLAECKHRDEEARRLLTLRDKNQRVSELNKIEAAHGKECRTRIERVILELWLLTLPSRAALDAELAKLETRFGAEYRQTLERNVSPIFSRP